MGRVLVAVALGEREARLLEEIARREGHGDLGRVLERALRLYLDASTSSRPVYSSPRGGRRRGIASP